jgi:hypothetical protein
MTLFGYDSVADTVAEWHAIVPVKDPQVIGSYRNGRYENEAVAQQAFPKARHVCYDVNASDPSADILDVEPGDAFPSQAGPWSKKYKGTLPLPAHYCSASAVSTLVSDMLDSGFKRTDFLVQSAHYTMQEHICGPGTCGYPQADGTQFADKGTKGQNTDLSVFEEHFFKKPSPVVLPHYDWYDGRKRTMLGRRSERDVAVEYDRLRKTQTKTKHPVGPRLRLVLLRAQCKSCAGRISKLGDLSKFHREFRRIHLLDRASGKRVV